MTSTTTRVTTTTTRKTGSPDDTFVLFLATVVAWFTLEFWRVLRGQESISGQGLVAREGMATDRVPLRLRVHSPHCPKKKKKK